MIILSPPRDDKLTMITPSLSKGDNGAKRALTMKGPMTNGSDDV
jgi:hypothetical protein